MIVWKPSWTRSGGAAGLSNLRRRVPFGHLSPGLRLDIRALFRNHQQALAKGLELLYAAGDPGEIEPACDGLKLGWQDEQALYVHRSLVDQPTIQNAFFHLCGDKFWHLIPAPGESAIYQPGSTSGSPSVAQLVLDKYPVTPGHTLIIPRRPVQFFRELTTAELGRLIEWASWAQRRVEAGLSPRPEGFNLGVNDGPAAGQTMPQFRFPVIPPYPGDVPDPRGGRRWVIPERARYW